MIAASGIAGALVTVSLYATAPDPQPDPPPRQATAVPEPWHSLALCESGMGGEPRWDYRGVHNGGYQFRPSTWTAYKPDGYPARAWQATPQQQTVVARRVLEAQGPSAWPHCSYEAGLR